MTSVAAAQPELRALPRLLRFSRRYLAKHWAWFGAGAITVTLTNWLSVLIPVELAHAIDGLRAGVPRAEILESAYAIALMGLAVIGVRTLSRVMFFTPGRAVEFDLRRDLFERLLALQPDFFAKHPTGDIINRATSDMQFIRVMTGFGSLQLFNVTVALLLTGRQMLLVSPLLSFLALLPVLLGVVSAQFGLMRFFTLTQKAQKELGDLSDHVLASLQGVRTVQGFNAHEAFMQRLAVREDAYLATNLSMAWLRQLVMPLLAYAGLISIFLIIAVGGPMAAKGEISVGELVALLAFVALLVNPLRGLGFMISVFQRGTSSLGRVDELLYAQPDRPEGDNPLPLPRGALGFSLRELNFSWPDSPDKQALKSLTLDIPPGAVVGVYGRTGSGKSTLLRLISRLANPPPGTLFVRGRDGAEVDITRVDLRALRERVSVVPQVPFLFSDSIAANVCMGEPDPARLEQALERAALRTDLGALPQGLDTVVGERGIMLSGGQRQRVALARGLYRDYDVLLLDDVLSAVDQRTERQLIDTLEQIAHEGREGRGRPTTLLISHRMSALARADKVLVLDEGRLVDQGTHEELLRREGPYLEAWQAQQDDAGRET